MQKKTMDELNRMSKDVFRSSEKSPIVVVLENVRSMHNVGSVFRTSDAFLIEKIYLCGYTPRPPHRDIHKTALGATETVAWEGYETAHSIISKLKSEGYHVLGIEQAHGSIMLNQYQHNEGRKHVVIFGNEAEGITEETLELCDKCIEIPQLGSKHSLNVSVAAGIVLWELSGKLKV